MATEEITRRGVLIADSSANMASLVAVMLRGLGRKDIREAYDGAATLLELKRRVFDILIIDADLEGMDGVAVTRKLRGLADCPNRDIPVIMMSAAPDARRIAQARDAGITEFLRKPFAVNHLQSRLLNIKTNPRGLIEANAYRGPDRRRKSVDVGDKERRDTVAAPKAS